MPFVISSIFFLLTQQSQRTGERRRFVKREYNFSAVTLLGKNFPVSVFLAEF
jgi:hypothetical protein